MVPSPFRHEVMSAPDCSIVTIIPLHASMGQHSILDIRHAIAQIFWRSALMRRPKLQQPSRNAQHRLRILWFAALALLGGLDIARAQTNESGDLSIELIDPKVLRVCADPRNMPFSNEKGEGFENKIAELFADKLGKRLAYTWYPSSTGFVRMTLGSFRCDVIMGFPQGGDLVQSTNPYYRSAYTLVTKPGSEFDGIDT